MNAKSDDGAKLVKDYYFVSVLSRGMSVTRRNRGFHPGCADLNCWFGIAGVKIPIDGIVTRELFRLLLRFRMSRPEDRQQVCRQFLHHGGMLLRHVVELARVGLQIVEAHITAGRGILKIL
jgi:hypothetical protein